MFVLLRFSCSAGFLKGYFWNEVKIRNLRVENCIILIAVGGVANDILWVSDIRQHHLIIISWCPVYKIRSHIHMYNYIFTDNNSVLEIMMLMGSKGGGAGPAGQSK